MKNFSNKSVKSSQLKVTDEPPKLKPGISLFWLRTIAVIICLLFSVLSVLNNAPFLKEMLISESIFAMLILLAYLNEKNANTIPK